MHKLSRPAFIDISFYKPLLGAALHVQEDYAARQATTIQDGEEDLLSPGLQDSKENFRFSNFDKLVKQTPFQTYSPQSGSPLIGQTRAQGAAVVPTPTGAEFLGLQSTGFASGFDSFDAVHTNSLSQVRSILKKGAKSRYSQDSFSLFVPQKQQHQFVEVVYGDD